MRTLYQHLSDNYNVTVIKYRDTEHIGGLHINAPSGSLLNKLSPNTCLSVIVPMDTFYNTECVCYETALYNTQYNPKDLDSHPVIYNEELGYTDVCRFSNTDEVSQELDRLGLNTSHEGLERWWSAELAYEDDSDDEEVCVKRGWVNVRRRTQENSSDNA